MVPYLRAANVKDGVLDLTDVKSMNFTPAEQQLFSLRAGDVLVTEGSGSLRSVGASAVWQGEIDGVVCFQNTLLRMRPRAGTTDGRFLAWWTRSAFASGLFASIATGANIYHISAERVRALPIELPPLEEQRRIADFLDAETARIDELTRLQGLVMDKLDERERAQLDSMIDDLVGQWGTVPLRRFLRGVDQGTSPQAEASPADPHEWGVLKVSCLRPGRFFPGENKRLPLDLEPDVRHEVREGDLLITRANTPQLVGSAAVVPRTRGKLLLSDKIFRVRLDQRVTAAFVATVARGSRIRDLCAASSNGASQSMANIRFDEVKAWPLPDAPLDAQHDLVRRVDRQRSVVDGLRSKIKQQAQLLTERRQSLITAAVTGQFDVTTASGRNVTEGVAV
ncbi:restriction endonuclease subunit S [Streptomyces thermoviolaceus]|uniref:restriction endonuclease subunit S n=1 Tax=Streptomyces thermoviolaceus TaxID=1952 RepID=UPI00386E45A3|nr:restriction endonuclease subunit S [Streptomyces thermoviolaceus]